MKLTAHLKNTTTVVLRQWSAWKSNSFIKNLVIATVGMSFISLGLLGWKWTSLPQSVPLWYSRAWGEDQLASPAWLFALPIGSLCWLLVSGILSAFMAEDEFFMKLLFFSSFLVGALSLFTLVRIVFLVT